MVRITEAALFYFFKIQTLKPQRSTAADRKEGCPWLQKDSTQKHQEKKETKQRTLRQPWQPLGVVNRECVMHSMQLWCQVACSKRRPSILPEPLISASLRRKPFTSHPRFLVGLLLHNGGLSRAPLPWWQVPEWFTNSSISHQHHTLAWSTVQNLIFFCIFQF